MFSGVGKTESEMRAALSADILCFNVESASELKRLDRVAGELGRTAPVSLRINPDVDANTHPYISTGLKESKFGVAYEDALPLYRTAAGMANLRITGIDCHISSQVTEIAPFVAALQKLLDVVDQLAAERIHYRAHRYRRRSGHTLSRRITTGGSRLHTRVDHVPGRAHAENNV